MINLKMLVALTLRIAQQDGESNIEKNKVS